MTTTPILVNVRAMDYNFQVETETFLEGDTSLVIGSGNLIKDRAGNYITDRAGNRILARNNWTGKPIILNCRVMDYNFVVEDR